MEDRENTLNEEIAKIKKENKELKLEKWKFKNRNNKIKEQKEEINQYLEFSKRWTKKN